jgi:hypothetical protein
MITAVLTSHSRFDLLATTLRSFYATVPASLKRTIVVEDGPDIPADIRRLFAGQEIEWVSTGYSVGQIAAIDYAYSRVDTPYIFHMDDDWHFYRSGFLERSLVVLQSNPKCLQVHIRALDDLNGHPVNGQVYTNRSVQWRQLALDPPVALQHGHGFSFAPALKRLSDYVSIGGYGIHTQFRVDPSETPERTIGRLYRRRDFFAAVLADEGGSGYTRQAIDGRSPINR